MARFAFRFDRLYRVSAAPFGVTPHTTMAEVAEGRLTVRFGPWVVDTPLSNVAEVKVTGPYSPWKTAGPAHLSLVDRGLTMATTSRAGLCVLFHSPVRGIDPFGWIRHPGLTLTVERIDALARMLTERHDGREAPRAEGADDEVESQDEASIAVVGESPWAILQRWLRWPVGIVVAIARFAALRLTGRVKWTVERRPSGRPLDDLPATADVQPIQAGVGRVYERIYRVTIIESDLTPEELMDRIAADLNSAAPVEVAEFVSCSAGADEALRRQEFLVRMPGPWSAPVRCIDRTATSFRLATLAGHMEAGQIEFRTSWAPGTDAGDDTTRPVVFEIHSVARSKGRTFRVLYDWLWFPAAMQQHMWIHVCQRAASLAGGPPGHRLEVRTIRYAR